MQPRAAAGDTPPAVDVGGLPASMPAARAVAAPYRCKVRRMEGFRMPAVPLGDEMARPSPGSLDCAAWLALLGSIVRRTTCLASGAERRALTRPACVDRCKMRRTSRCAGYRR